MDRKELSSKIGKLFTLREGEFNPELHLPIAESIVESVGLKKSYFFRLSDLFSVSGSFIDSNGDRQSFKYGHEIDPSSGLYNIRHSGRLVKSAYLGLHPKLEINYWKQDVFSFSEETKEYLDISYEGSTVLGLRRYFVMPNMVDLYFLKIGLSSQGEIWSYKRK